MALQTDDPFLASPLIPHERLRIAVTARRIAYLKLGYEPIPVLSGRKRPALNNWQDIPITVPPDEDVITPWGETYPGALSTGIRTRYTPGFDIDIKDQKVADQVEQALLNMVPGGTILKRVGQPPKRLIPFRCTTPFKKISATFKASDETVHKVEVLADGQQFVAEGIHETTQQPYRWADNVNPLSVAHEHLPLVDEELARRFVAEAGEIMKRAGWSEVGAQGKPKNNGKPNGRANGNTETAAKAPGSSIYGRTALRSECAKLAAMDKDSGRNNQLNSASFNLHQLVASGDLDQDEVRDQLFAAAEKNGLVGEDGVASVRATIESGARAGAAQPRQRGKGATPPSGQQDDGGGRTQRKLPLVPFHQLVPGTSSPYLVKALIPRTGLVAVWGPPKCGKSFWVFDLALHVALGWDYRGHRVLPGPAVYCAFEGAEGYKARAAAFRLKHRIETEPPFYLLPMRLDLVKEHPALIAAIQAQLGGERPVLVALDTLNRSIAGSESSDEDMTAYLNAADAIAEAFGCVVVIIHHCGVDGTRPRGHTSLTGTVVAQLAVKRDTLNNIVVMVEWMKDGPEGEVVSSRLETVEVGTDEDGEAITSCVVRPSEVTAGAVGRKATGAAKIAFDLLVKAIAESGEVPPASNHIPTNTRTCRTSAWRSYCYAGTVSESDNPDTKQKAFVRAAKQLQTLGIIGIWNDNVWVTGHAGHSRT